MIILIGGIPGVGKSTIAIELARKLGIEVASTDIMREVVRANDKSKNPFLFSVTHECWKLLGEKNYENVVGGMLMHAKCLKHSILSLIKKSCDTGQNLIIEGVHVVPELMPAIRKITNNACMFILLLKNKTTHVQRFNLKNAKRSKVRLRWYQNIEVMRAIQSYFIETSEDAAENIFYIENRSLAQTIQKIYDVITNTESTFTIGAVSEAAAKAVLYA